MTEEHFPEDEAVEKEETKIHGADDNLLADGDEVEMTVFLDDDDDSAVPVNLLEGADVTELVGDDDDLLLDGDEPTDPDTPIVVEDDGDPVSEGEGSDQVFVILPDKMDGEATESMGTLDDLGDLDDLELTEAVEVTEAIDDESLDTDVTERVDEELESIGLRTEIGGAEESEAEEPTELVDDEELDFMASDVDEDDVLMAGEGDVDGYPDEDEFSEFEDEDEVAPRRSALRWLLPLAAALVLGFAGYQYYVDPGVLDKLVAWYDGTAGTEVAQGGTSQDSPLNTQGDGGPDAEVVVDDIDGPGDGTDSLLSEEEEVQRAFRNKVLLALRLGFGGDDAHD